MKAKAVLGFTGSAVWLKLHQIVHSMEHLIVWGFFPAVIYPKLNLALLMLTFEDNCNSGCNFGMAVNETHPETNSSDKS